LIAGTGLGPPLVMMKFIELEVPSPGAGLVTVTAIVPVEAMLAAAMVAVNCVELTNVMAGAALPKLTRGAGTLRSPKVNPARERLPTEGPTASSNSFPSVESDGKLSRG
jgi:hypothetical protein